MKSCGNLTRFGAWALALGGLGSLPAYAGTGLILSHATMRVIITARPAAGYFILRNGTDRVFILIGANSKACAKLTLHKSIENDGVSKMLPVKKITVVPHGVLMFAPGGYHLMCMQPEADIKTRGHVRVTLDFAGGTTVSGDFKVSGPGN